MFDTFVEKFWHGTLKRPYRLARTIDEGQGEPIVLLHGLGRSGQVWKYVVKGLLALDQRVIAFDLLGFGQSPKPKSINYDIDDHARAVIAALSKLPRSKPMILVGHSMGCLIAVRVARLRPDLIKHLVLYEMPLYEGLPQKRHYRLRTDLYFKLYKWVTQYQPSFGAASDRRVKRLAQKIAGLEVTPETWQPFIKSLQYTIMQQTTAEDIKQLDVPMDVIYGRLDMLVIRGKPREIFGEDTNNITAHTIRARHEITPKASKFIVQRVQAALTNTSLETAQQAAHGN